MKKLTKEQMEHVRSTFPEWFNGIEVGKWYNLNHGKCLMFVTGFRHGDTVVGCGFDYGGNWQDDGSLWGTDGAAEATPEEVKQALIAEAKRRYKEGDSIECLDGNTIRLAGHGFIFFNGGLYASGIHDAYGEDDVHDALFREGEWASVIPQEKPSLQYDIQALKDRWPNINFTVIAEEKK